MGIDVASQPAGTAACWVRWDGAGATIESIKYFYFSVYAGSTTADGLSVM